MRHLIHQHEMRVYPGAAIAQAGGGGDGATYVAGPDGGGQAVIAVVRPSDGLIEVGEGGD